MKRLLHNLVSDTRDLLAIIIVITWAVSIYLPEDFVGDQTQRSFEAIMMMVLGFFFGSRQKPPTIEPPSAPPKHQPGTCYKDGCADREVKPKF